MAFKDVLRRLRGEPEPTTSPPSSVVNEAQASSRHPNGPPEARLRVRDVTTGPPTPVPIASDYTLDDLVFTVVQVPDFAPPADLVSNAYALQHFTDQLFEAIAASFESIDQVMLLGERDEQDNLLAGPTKGFVYRDEAIVPFLFEAPHRSAWFSLAIESGTCCIVGRESGGSGADAKYTGGASNKDQLENLASFLRSCDPRRDPYGLKAPKNGDVTERAKLLASADRSERVVVDAHDVAASWRRLVELGALQQNPPATDTDVASFQRAAGFALPAELEVLYRITNGATNAFGHIDFAPLSRLISFWEEWDQIFNEWSLDDLQSSGAADDRVLGMYTTPKWIPFSDESTGNHYALDLLPGPSGRRGQIIYFGADESDRVSCIADDLVDFLERAAQRNLPPN